MEVDVRGIVTSAPAQDDTEGNQTLNQNLQTQHVDEHVDIEPIVVDADVNINIMTQNVEHMALDTCAQVDSLNLDIGIKAKTG
jgi:hypothetical protein